TLSALSKRFRYFEHGTCVVHHMFGADVVRRIASDHADAYVTAHFEVPGEMFELGLTAQQSGRGVVGSTSNILGFIADKVAEASRGGVGQRLSFILGTEAGMIASIVRRVQTALRDSNGRGLEVEIVFPVA